MRENRSSGSVGEQDGNDLLYPDSPACAEQSPRRIFNVHRSRKLRSGGIPGILDGAGATLMVFVPLLTELICLEIYSQCSSEDRI
ncbi:MAG: hypothetical protein K9I74_04035 [Bacteroidales bacterium]|nr:hypothetical protein [Bacteroidales bacterium]